MPPLVFFTTDQPDWAFDHIARYVSTNLAARYVFQTQPFRTVAKGECDILVNLWWASTLRVKANMRGRGEAKHPKVVACVYDALSWSIDESSRKQFELVLKNIDGLIVCNEALLEQLRTTFPRSLPYVTHVIEDGVDTALFQPRPMPAELTGGWTGNSHRHTPGGPTDHKGLNLIKEARSISGIAFNILDAAATGGSWPIKRMPEFYETISFYVCASVFEGTPNPILEAMSCARPVISTDVGIASKVIQEGRNGYIVERDVNAIASAMSLLRNTDHNKLVEMGRAARESVKHWDWSHRASRWHDFFQQVLYQPARTNYFTPMGKSTSDGLIHIEHLPRETFVPNDPPKVLLISDVPDWAFHQNMKDLEEYLKDDFDFEHWFVVDFLQHNYFPDMNRYDAVFRVYHEWNIDSLLPWGRVVSSLRAQWFNPGTMTKPGPAEYNLVNKYQAFHVVTQANYDELKDHCPNVVYLTNPVNMTRFAAPCLSPHEEVVASWNGNARHINSAGVDVKGFNSLVVPGCHDAGVRLHYAEYNTKKLSPSEMPQFYSEANIAVCMSLYEGASNSVMEAMAAGQALITTRAGNAVEMHNSQLEHFGTSGIILIDRDQEALTNALEDLKEQPDRIIGMGRLNKQEIDERWSWSAWKDRYKDFLLKAAKTAK